MPSPFPGMDPYLENPELWHQVHNRLIVEIADALTLQVAPTYWVSIEERVYTIVETPPLVGIADVAVSRRDLPGTGTMVTTPKQFEPNRIRLPIPEEVTERFLEVRAARSQEVISVIEVLSPKNKRSGEGRVVYLAKRQKILGSATNLIEIDLLRGGETMPVWGVTEGEYRILVSRASDRPEADLYCFRLPDPIPIVPVPLRINEPEPAVDLQQLLNDVYDRARFDLAIDYSQPVKPALDAEAAAWVNQLLREKGLNG